MLKINQEDRERLASMQFDEVVHKPHDFTHRDIKFLRYMDAAISGETRPTSQFNFSAKYSDLGVAFAVLQNNEKDPAKPSSRPSVSLKAKMAYSRVAKYLLGVLHNR